MHVIRARNLNDAFLQLCKVILRHGKLVDSRDMSTLEIHPLVLEIEKPRERFLSIVGRGNNPFQTIYETLWVFAGRNDVEALSYYMPRASNYSDDGKTWRGGYGPRLFTWGDDEKTNQIANVVAALKKDINTRQAVIEIWDPALDSNPDLKTKDRPCTNYLHFMVRDNALDIMVIMRSNDMWWGFNAINVFEWSFLQEYIASFIGRFVGKMYYIADSFHIYNSQIPNLIKVLNQNQVDIYSDTGISSWLQVNSVNNIVRYYPARMNQPLKVLTNYIDSINSGFKNIIHDNDPYTIFNDTRFEEVGVKDTWFKSAFHALQTYYLFKKGEHNKNIETVLAVLSECAKIAYPDMRVVALEFLCRYYKKFLLKEPWVEKKVLDIVQDYPVASLFVSNTIEGK